MPFPRKHKAPLTTRQIQTIAYLLEGTDESAREIGETIGCTPLSVSRISEKFRIRSWRREADSVAPRTSIPN